jgi:hypothetical protein
MRGRFDCLECQYENQVGKRGKKINPHVPKLVTIMQHAPLLSGGGAETLWSSWKLGFGHRTTRIF